MLQIKVETNKSRQDNKTSSLKRMNESSTTNDIQIPQIETSRSKREKKIKFQKIIKDVNISSKNSDLSSAENS